MRTAVIIPTFGRPDILGRLLRHIEDQERLPDQVVVAAPDDAHLPRFRPSGYPLSLVLGATGLASQRNSGLGAVSNDCDIVTFLDDDFLPAKNYVLRLCELFDTLPDVVAAIGHVAIDGGRGGGLTFDEGLMLLHAAEKSASMQNEAVYRRGTYGSNMSVRKSLLDLLRFDERLVLYGWQEDIDFTGQLWRHGRVARMPSLFGVHLGASGGQVSGVRFGYSQIINPTYLTRKGSTPKGLAVRLMARSVAANVAKSLWSDPRTDRLGRLRGNLIGAYHLLRGRVEPEHVLKL